MRIQVEFSVVSKYTGYIQFSLPRHKSAAVISFGRGAVFMKYININGSRKQTSVNNVEKTQFFGII